MFFRRDETPASRSLVVVLGMHRSGTSLCANILHEMGVDMADEPGESPANRRGHWERPRINDLNDSIFTAFGRGWNDAAHSLALPEHWLSDPRTEWVRRELAAYFGPKLKACGAIGFKDPRTSRLMPLWRQVFADLGVTPRFVFCVRNPAQVARSLTARDRMTREQAEYRWLVYNAEAVAGCGGDPVCVLPYEAWFTEPSLMAARLARFVRRPALSESALPALVSADLRHDEAAPPARAMAQRMHGLLMRDEGKRHFDAEVRQLAGLAVEFEQQVQPMLVDAEIMRTSVAAQNRVIADLNGAIRDLRRAEPARSGLAA